MPRLLLPFPASNKMRSFFVCPQVPVHSCERWHRVPLPKHARRDPCTPSEFARSTTVTTVYLVPAISVLLTFTHDACEGTCHRGVSTGPQRLQHWNNLNLTAKLQNPPELSHCEMILSVL